VLGEISSTLKALLPSCDKQILHSVSRLVAKHATGASRFRLSVP
jgi:hypothetical protein